MAVMTYATLSEVPDDLRDFAKEAEDGTFAVKVAPFEKITEFRENNVKARQERDDLVAKVSRYETVTGVNIDELEKLDDFAKVLEGLRETKKQVEDGNLVASTTLEEATQQRLTEATQNFRSQLESMAKERDAHKQRANRAEEGANQMRIENAIRLVASDPEVAMIDKAVNFMLPNAYNVFKIDEGGKLVPKTSDGTIIYGSDGVNPMTVKEWLLKEREAHDFMFKGSKGGGASGADQKIGGRLSQAELAKMKPADRINYARQNGLG